MVRTLFIYLLVFTGKCSFGQNTFALQIGLGAVTSFPGSPTPTPDLETSYLKNLSPRWAAGLSLGYQKYMFNYIMHEGNRSKDYWLLLQVNQKSTYAFLSPQIATHLIK